MHDTQSLLDFIWNDDMQIIEQTPHCIIIRQLDICLRIPGTTFDYEDYLQENIEALERFKQDVMERKERKLIKLISAATTT